VVAKVRERLAVSKQAALKFNVERFNFRKLNELEVRKQHQIEISNGFALLCALVLQFPIMNSLKQGHASSPIIFNFALDYDIRRFQVNEDGLKLNGTHKLLV
jgi:hypothetical protein